MSDITFVQTQEKDFSNVIYKDLYDHVLDIHQLPGTYIMCNVETLDEIIKKIEKSQQTNIHYLGNGNYHYLTFAVLAQIKEPFTLVLFDHHNDAGELTFPNMVSCGSWVQNAIEELEYLEEVFIIGAGAENKKQAKEHVSAKIHTLNEDQLSKQNLNQFINGIKTKNIYVSIDRDILSEKVVQTNWSQGEVRLEELLKSLQLVCEGHSLIGADVCGDIVWNYQTMTNYRKKRIREQSVAVNKQIFDTLEKLLHETTVN